MLINNSEMPPVDDSGQRLHREAQRERIRAGALQAEAVRLQAEYNLTRRRLEELRLRALLRLAEVHEQLHPLR